MRAPIEWLKQHCDADLAPEALAERLAMTGTEVERVSGEGDAAVLELEVTPNRPDCFGVYGVAREVHAISGKPLAEAPWAGDAEATGEGDVADYASVSVEVPDLNPRFTARVFTDVTVGPSPGWMVKRLEAAGGKSINNVVDITNYVMLLTGQPLHAFDLDLVPDGALIVRAAEQGETLRTLDDEDRELEEGVVLVCDKQGPTAIAGIMGGERSEVSDSTTRVLLEVANWDGPSILRASAGLGLRSEASTRFEKQLHPELAMRAQIVASKLMVDPELCGAKLVPGTIDIAAAESLTEPARLTLRPERVEGLLGMAIDADTCATYLDRLGFGVERDGGSLTVTVPPDRHYDVTREVDLVEEVARVHGIDEHLPTTLPAAREMVGGLTREQQLGRRAEDVLRDLGFDEVVGWSFTDPDENARLRNEMKSVALSNPLSEDQSVLRTTLLGSLLDAAAYNRARHASRVALFESGRVYRGLTRSKPAASEAPGSTGLTPVVPPEFPGKRQAPVTEPSVLGALALGMEFLELKGALEALAGQLGAELTVEPADAPFLQPGREAHVLLGGQMAGWIGELHPLVLKEWDLEQAVAFELATAVLIERASSGHEQYEDVTSYPAVFQDIAVVVEEEVAAGAVREAVFAGGGELLRAAEVFDVYRGEQLEDGKKSLAMRLEFRWDEGTLTDEEVARYRESIRKSVEKVGGSLRE